MVVVHKEKAFPHQGEVAQVAALVGSLGGHCAMKHGHRVGIF